MIVLGELYTGAFRKATRRDVALRTVEEFATLTQILRPDRETAIHYGRLRAGLAEKGTPVPDNDIWIAAMAVQYRIPLANRDGHFDLIEGLLQEKW